jgi:citrate lyase beta subunit
VLLVSDNVISEILRAAKIVHNMEKAHIAQKGAVGLEGEMIDAPMIKQVSACLIK